MFQVTTPAELAALQDGAGTEGSLGVIYQDRATGVVRVFNPTSGVLQSVDGGALIATASAADLPNNAVAASGFLLAATATLPGGSMGRNGRCRIYLEVENWSSSAATVRVYISGQLVLDVQTTDGGFWDVTMYNRNSTQSQRCRTALQVRDTRVNTDVDLPVEVYVQKSVASDVVRVRRLSLETAFDDRLAAEASYHTTSGLQTVTEADLLLSPLPSRVTSDPMLSVRSLSATSYAFPANFWNVCTQGWPVGSNAISEPPFEVRGYRTQDCQPDTGWLRIQTAQATQAYSNPTGAAPSGIDATRLAKLDAMFAHANATGRALIFNVTHNYSPSTPAWATALGLSDGPLTLPAAGANRTAAINSLGFLIRYYCQRYTTLYPSLEWYIEPVNEPNLQWGSNEAALVAMTNVIRSNVDAFGAGKVKLLSSSWTDRASVSFLNPGAAVNTLHAYLGNGGWADVDILTYHLYGGQVGRPDITSSGIFRGLFSHDLSIIDPLNNATTQGRFVGLQQMLQEVGITPTIVPGVSVAGKPFWITETGEGNVVSRDRNHFIRLALIASSQGVSRYFFYYWANGGSALPDMDLTNCAAAFKEAQDFLRGKTINYVNATRDLSRVGAGINGQAYLF